jgi:hypothetical protein
MGLGGVGHWGVGVSEENCVHIHTYTHVGSMIAVGEKLDILELQLILKHSQRFQRQTESQIGAQLMR